MWSSPSLCLAALWLKRGAPREPGGSRPAQSVLSLPWSPACRPQKGSTQTFRKAYFIAAPPPPPAPAAPKNLQSKHRLSWSGSFLGEGGLTPMRHSSSRRRFSSFFWWFNEDILHISESASLPMKLSTLEIRYKENFWWVISQKVPAKRKAGKFKYAYKLSLIPSGVVIIWLKYLFFQKHRE